MAESGHRGDTTSNATLPKQGEAAAGQARQTFAAGELFQQGSLQRGSLQVSQKPGVGHRNVSKYELPSEKQLGSPLLVDSTAYPWRDDSEDCICSSKWNSCSQLLQHYCLLEGCSYTGRNSSFPLEIVVFLEPAELVSSILAKASGHPGKKVEAQLLVWCPIPLFWHLCFSDPSLFRSTLPNDAVVWVYSVWQFSWAEAIGELQTELPCSAPT